MNQSMLQWKTITINSVLADVHDNIIPLDHAITKQAKEIVKVVINDYLIDTMKTVSHYMKVFILLDLFTMDCELVKLLNLI